MRWLYGAMTSLCLAACGPAYETNVHLTPPPTATGQVCTTQCLKTQNECTDACTAGQQQCEQRARLQDDFDYTLYGGSGFGPGFGRGTGLGFGYGDGLRGYELCRATACEARCQEHMYECYTHCGGGVQRTTRCVKNCPSEAPH